MSSPQHLVTSTGRELIATFAALQSSKRASGLIKGNMESRKKLTGDLRDQLVRKAGAAPSLSKMEVASAGMKKEESTTEKKREKMEVEADDESMYSDSTVESTLRRSHPIVSQVTTTSHRSHRTLWTFRCSRSEFLVDLFMFGTEYFAFDFG